MNKPRTALGLILIFIGIGIFLKVDVFRIIIPALLIYWGYQALTGTSTKVNPLVDQQVSLDELNDTAIFTGFNRKIDSTNFQGGKVTVVFGGGKIDLSEVKTKAETVELEINAVFGGLQLIVPENWRISAETAAIFGGVTHSTPAPKTSQVELKLKGAAVFGGIEILRK